MLHDEVKKAMEDNDIKSLKYEFAGCLDGDPTFEDSLDDYRACIEWGKFFEPHRELTPFRLNNIDEVYWVQLRNDFMENPSTERLEHMREVAKIFYKERIEIIKNSRKPAPKPEIKPEPKPVVEKPVEEIIEEPAPAPVHQTVQQNTAPRRVSEPVSETRRVSEPVGETYSQSSADNGEPSKKAVGVGSLIMVAALIAIIAIIVNLLNK